MASQSSLQKEVADYLEGLSRFNVNPLWSVMQAAVRITRPCTGAGSNEI